MGEAIDEAISALEKGATRLEDYARLEAFHESAAQAQAMREAAEALREAKKDADAEREDDEQNMLFTLRCFACPDGAEHEERWREWYEPENWLGEHRATGQFIAMLWREHYADEALRKRESEVFQARKLIGEAHEIMMRWP